MRRLIIPFMMSLVLLLTACNGSGGNAEDAAIPSPEDAEEPAPEEPDEATAEGEATEGTEGEAGEGDVEALYEEAQNEPRLVWYSSQTPGQTEAVVEAFRERYPGVDIEGLRLTSGPMAVRYAEERDAGVVNADLITIADPNFIDEGLEQGWFIDIEQSELPALQELPERWFTSGATTVSISLLGFGYNTERVTAELNTWEDLLDTEYQGEIILGDPRTVPSYMAIAQIWREELGDEFLEGLAAQNLILTDSVVPATEQLGAGEVAIVVPNVRQLVDPAIEAGAPLEFVVPDLTTGVEYIAVLSDGADSPSAARLLYNFLLTDEGQIAYNGTFSASPFGELGETDPLPADYRAPNIRALPEHEEEIIQLLGLS